MPQALEALNDESRQALMFERSEVIQDEMYRNLGGRNIVFRSSKRNTSSWPDTLTKWKASYHPGESCRTEAEQCDSDRFRPAAVML